MSRLDDRIKKTKAEIDSLQVKIAEKKKLVHTLELQKKEEEKRNRIRENEKIREAIENRFGEKSLDEVMDFLSSHMEGGSEDGRR